MTAEADELEAIRVAVGALPGERTIAAVVRALSEEKRARAHAEVELRRLAQLSAIPPFLSDDR